MKTFRKLGICLMAIMFAFNWVSCSDDNNDDEPVVQEELTPVYALDLEVNKAFLDFADIIVDYIGEDGNLAQDKMVSTKFSKKITPKALPAKIKVAVSYQLKEGIDASAVYDIQLDMEHSIKALNSKNEIVFSNTKPFNLSESKIKGTDLPLWCEIHNELLKGQTYTISVARKSDGGLIFN